MVNKEERKWKWAMQQLIYEKSRSGVFAITRQVQPNQSKFMRGRKPVGIRRKKSVKIVKEKLI